MPAVTPGPTITRVTTRSAPTGLTDTSVWNVIGFADRGSTTGPTTILNMTDYATKLGLRTSVNGDDNSVLYDALDAYFALGGSAARVQRFVGPGAVTATITMLDGSSAVVATVNAANPGAWGNTLTYTVQTNAEDSTIPSGSFVVIVYLSGTEVERSPILADKTALLQWAPATAGTGQSQYLALVSGASANDPAAVVARALASGTGDRGSVGATQWTNALNLLTADLGPGQASFPGATTAAAHALVQAHADSHNRVALLDAIDSPTTATVTAVAATDRGQTGNEMSGMFWPWIVIPGLTSGTTRTVPPSAAAAALMARNDLSGNTPNVPAAGDLGEIGGYAVGLSQAAVSDVTRGMFNQAGVNVFRPLLGGFRLYGYRTLADPVTNPNWIGLNNARFYTLLAARLDLTAEAFELDELTKHKVAEYQGALTGVLSEYWKPNGEGSLVGDSFSDAASVDTSIDTDQYLAGNQLGATASVHMAGMAERVPINIRKVPITEAVG